MTKTCWLPPESPAGMFRIRVLPSSGMGCWLGADFPFNDSDWSGQLLQNDPRWKYGMPPAGNANFAWLQHMIFHLSPKGIMACVLSNGSLSSQASNEGN